MKQTLLAGFLAVASTLPLCAEPAAAPAEPPGSRPLTPQEELATFKVPDGYTIELVAMEDPAQGIGKFVPLAFDQHGRLWTSTALEYPVDGNENPVAADALYSGRGKDKVLVFDTPFASGVQTPRVFADGLAITVAVLPYGDGCYVQHGHDIILLRDTDGDGKADKREVILTGFGVQDSHLFPHQFTRTPGDFIIMAQGAFNYGKVRRAGEPEGKALKFDQTRMAKFHPDGSAFDITSNGPCNIWGLVLNGEGEIFIQEANDYGYPLMPFDEYANYPGCSDRTWKSYSPEYPGTAPDFSMGGTGLSGLALTDATGPFTEPWRDVMLLANPITNRVNAIRMHRDGPRLKLEHLSDFVESTDPWFRPVAVTIGPDGCLYLVDWYNKIISHNEVPRNHPDRDKTRGRIWRVKPVAGHPFEVPDFTKLSNEELVAKLGGPSLAQSHLSWQTLSDRSLPENQPNLAAIVRDASQSPARRIQAEWALELLGKDPEIQRVMAKDPNADVRREAIRSSASNPAWTIHEVTQETGFKSLANDPDPTVRQELIKRLGRSLEDESSGDSSALELLLSMAKAPLDGPFAPSTRDGKPIKVREAYDREFERYLVRLFLEQHPERVAKFLDSEAARSLPVEARLLASLALEPKASAPRVAQLLPQLERAPGQEEVLRLAQFPGEPGVGESLQASLQAPATREAVLQTLLTLRAQLDGARLTPLLTGAAAQLLAASDPARQELGAKIISAYKIEALEPQLLALIQGSTASANPAIVRAALRALAELRSAQSELFATLAQTSPDVNIRNEALITLIASKAADAPQRVLALYPKLGVADQRHALDRLASSKAGAQAVVAALSAGTVPKSDLEAGTLDRLQAVLGPEDPTLSKLVDSLGALFHPVLSLDGSDAAWAQTNITLDGPCTVEAWVRLDEIGRRISNADGIGGAPEQADINFASGRFRVYIFGLGDVVIAKQPIMPGLWTHVAATRNAEGIWKTYIDGEPDNTGTIPGPKKIENYRIGWTSAAGGPHGALTEFRLWNRERTLDEIRATCNRSLTRAGGTDPALLFSSADGQWPGLQPGAQVIKTSDYPPVLTGAEAAKLDEQYQKFRLLANAPGDVEKGHAVAALCMTCHLMGPTGGNIGPNLSGVGAMGTEGILRNVIEPSAAMENAYRIYRVEMNNGDLVDALFVSEDQQAVIVRAPGLPDRRIAKADIRSTKYLRRSLMPDGLLDTMPPGSVSDLFAFLRTLK